MVAAVEVSDNPLKVSHTLGFFFHFFLSGELVAESFVEKAQGLKLIAVFCFFVVPLILESQLSDFSSRNALL